MEPMVEIFLEEAGAIVSEMKDCVDESRLHGAFEREHVDCIFRAVHTIKADAAMMLYDNIAEPARTLERVLYYYRDKSNGVTDLEGFLGLLDENISFFDQELEKIMEEMRPDGDSRELTGHINDYLAKITGEEPQSTDNSDTEEDTFFYISSAQEETNDVRRETNTEFKQETAEVFSGGNSEVNSMAKAFNRDDSEEAVQHNDKDVFIPVLEPTIVKRPKHVLVSTEEMDNLDSINMRLMKYANTTNAKVQSILRELDNWLWRIHSTDFTLMAAKLDMTVRGMLEHMDKNVEFHVTGSEMTIEKAKIDKISNAMIHLVRNAVDHGIESPEERLDYGKSKRGYVNVAIERMSDYSGIRIRISDDGRGMDMYEILDKAHQKNLLTKPYEEYTEQEAFDLIFQPGFTTRDTAGEYSGRGVGMDVVRHSLEEIGGTIRIESVYHVGTSFIMEIAYDINVGNDDQAKRRALIDESVNSRR